MKIASRAASSLAMAAALSLSATPALARGWGDWGRHHRHHDRVDAGDIFAGLLIFGGIAAIASAAGKSNKDNRAREAGDRDPDYREPSARYGDGGDRQDYRGAPVGINEAIDRCVGEVERGSERVDTVDSVNRDAEGWRIDGRISGGGDFACTIDGDGRIRRVAVDGEAI